MPETTTFYVEQVPSIKYACPLRNCAWEAPKSAGSAHNLASILSAATVHELDAPRPSEATGQAISHHIEGEHSKVDLVREIKRLQLEYDKLLSTVSAPRENGGGDNGH